MREAVSEAAPETLADRRVHPATIPIRLLKEAPSTIIGLPAFLAIASDVGWLTILGVAAAAAVARVLESLLYGVSGIDPVAYLAAGGVLLLVAMAANLIPAFTAATIDPVRALRTE